MSSVPSYIGFSYFQNRLKNKKSSSLSLCWMSFASILSIDDTVCISSIPYRQIRFLVFSMSWFYICSIFNPCLLPLIPMVILNSFPSPPNLNYLISMFSELLIGLSLIEICINIFGLHQLNSSVVGCHCHLLHIHLLFIHADCV